MCENYNGTSIKKISLEMINLFSLIDTCFITKRVILNEKVSIEWTSYRAYSGVLLITDK